jgi:hypothetical protein
MAVVLGCALGAAACGVDSDAARNAGAPSKGGASEPAVRGLSTPPAIVLEPRSALVSGAKLAGFVDVAALRASPLLGALRSAGIGKLDEGLNAFRQKCAFDLFEGVDAVGFSQTPTGEVVLAARVAVPLERFMGCLRRLGFEETVFEGRVAGRRKDTIAVAQDGVVVLGAESEVRLVLSSGQPDAALAERLALVSGEVARVSTSVSRKLERLDARVVASNEKLALNLDLVFASVDDAREGEGLVRGIWAKSVEEAAPKSPIAEPRVRTERERVVVEHGVEGGADAQLAFLSSLSQVVAHMANAYSGEVPAPNAAGSAAPADARAPSPADGSSSRDAKTNDAVSKAAR